MTCAVGRIYDELHPTCRSCVVQSATVCRGQLQKKASKYGNQKVNVDGVILDSKREAVRYLELLTMVKYGAITDLRRQVPYVLQLAVVLDGRKKPCLKYVADFVYKRCDGVEIIEDTKSPYLRKHQTYRLKKHLMASVLGLSIVEI